MSGVAISASSVEPMATVGRAGPDRAGRADRHPEVSSATIASRPSCASTRAGRPPSSPATLDVKILDAKAVTMYSVTETLTSDRFGASRGADCRLELPLAKLDAGLYLLTMQATPRDAGGHRSGMFGFVVR